MLDLPDDIDANDKEALYKFFSQHTLLLTSLQQAIMYQHNSADCQRQLHVTRLQAF